MLAASSTASFPAIDFKQFVGRWTSSPDNMRKDGSFPGNRTPFLALRLANEELGRDLLRFRP